REISSERVASGKLRSHLVELAAELSNSVWAIRVRQSMSDAESRNQTELKSIAPQFAVPDVIAAAQYYRDILGFRILGYFGQAPVFSIVARDNVEIQLGKSDPTAGPAHNSVQREGGLDAYVWVTDVDSSFAELRAAQISSNRHNSASTTATKWSSKTVSVPLAFA